MLSLRYITCLLSFLITLGVTPMLIIFMRSKFNLGQPIREYGPQSHIVSKQGTPTMGGLVMLFSIILGMIIVPSKYLGALLLTVVLFGGLGFVDDYIKLTRRAVAGVLVRYKLLVQFVCAMMVCYVLHLSHHDPSIAVPFTHFVLHMHWSVYLFFASVVIVASSNAVNLTDGLDGLAIVPIMLSAVYFGWKSQSLVSVAQMIVGSGLGFLWFNAFPAKIFMGDVGSLSLGALLGVMSVISHSELEFLLVGLVFVVEALSVIIQVASFKLRNGKRVFLMAPIHHHFEKLGWHEQTIVVRCWIVALLLFVLSVALSLKFVY